MQHTFIWSIGYWVGLNVEWSCSTWATTMTRCECELIWCGRRFQCLQPLQSVQCTFNGRRFNRSCLSASIGAVGGFWIRWDFINRAAMVCLCVATWRSLRVELERNPNDTNVRREKTKMVRKKYTHTHTEKYRINTLIWFRRSVVRLLSCERCFISFDMFGTVVSPLLCLRFPCADDNVIAIRFIV